MKVKSKKLMESASRHFVSSIMILFLISIYLSYRSNSDVFVASSKVSIPNQDTSMLSRKEKKKFWLGERIKMSDKQRKKFASRVHTIQNDIENAFQNFSWKGENALAGCLPSLQDDIPQSMREPNNRYSMINHGNYHNFWRCNTIIENVSAQVRERTNGKIDIFDCLKKPLYIYGIDPDTMMNRKRYNVRIRKPKLKDSMNEALEELKVMRQEMEQLRVEMEQIRRRVLGEEGGIGECTDQYSLHEADRIRKQRDAETLAHDIELWGKKMLQEGENDGWKRLECNKIVKSSVNEMDRTTAYMKWMPDSRGDKANKDDNGVYPCIKCYSTIDAPLEVVCTYLSQPENCPQYNEVVKKHEDLEEISPSAKICWSQSPQILFVKPRDFITFCHHRWKSDGTEIIVNQACDHPKYPIHDAEKKRKSCRGYALRGINIISRCSEDPSKTQILIVAHANPGGDLPEWATKTAVNAVAPIEPFKLFHNINEKVKNRQSELEDRIKELEKISADVSSGSERSKKPGGMSQLGYACFWPDGGGKVEREANLTMERDDIDGLTLDGTNNCIDCGRLIKCTRWRPVSTN